MGTVAAAAALAVIAFASPQAAEAHGRHGSWRGPVVVSRGFYGYPYFGFGAWNPYWGPWGAYGWGPYAYGPQGGLDLNVAMIAGYGAIDLNVKPKQAEVWVDGEYFGEARDLDGAPSYLWLPEGAHHVTIYKGGYASFDEKLDVRRGQRKELKVRLEKGESQPPGQKPEGYGS